MAREESRGKRPFKIWDGFRSTRKSLVASSLKDLEIRGKEKLNIAQNESIKLVLETDGTQIEDPEYFKTLPNNTTVLLLRNDEFWYPAGVDAIKTAIAAIPKIVCETIHALELQNETPSWKIMDNKGRVTVVLHWDQRHCRGSASGGMDASPSKKTAAHQQTASGPGVGGLLMENGGAQPCKRDSEQAYQPAPQHHHQLLHQSVPAAFRHASTPQITVIHHDHMPAQMAADRSSQPQLHQARRLSKQGSSSLDAAAIHVHTPECAHRGGPGSPAAHDPTAAALATTGTAAPSLYHPAAADGFECDFHCCALHEEGRRIAVHKSVATSPIQECGRHHAAASPLHPQQQQQQQPAAGVGQQPASSLSDGARRSSPKGHVRFLDADSSPPLPPPPPPLLRPPSPPGNAASGGKSQQQQRRAEAESSESETETTVIEDDSMTSEKFLLLIDQLTGKQDRHLTVKDIGIILERLNSKIVDVERLDRDYEATDCYNWTIKATIRGDVLQELGIIYNGSYYGISEHPGYRQSADGEEEEEDDDDDVDDDEDGGDGDPLRANDEDDGGRGRRADEEVNI